MKLNDVVNGNMKSTMNKALATKGIRKISTGANAIYKPAKEPPTECNPDNGAFFEERSNPLSSKGN